MTSSPTPPTPSPPPEAKRGLGLYWTIGGLGLIVFALAGVATWQLGGSTRYLNASLKTLEVKGDGLDLEGCMTAAIEWRGQCEAMASLCDSYLGQAVERCLARKPRAEECRPLLAERRDTHAKFDRCSKLGFERRKRTQWKRCGVAYGAALHHCEKLGGSP